MEDEILIGNRIRSAREELGLSQEELSKAVGVTPQSVHQWETGRTFPRNSRIRKIAAVLGVTANWIQFGVSGDDQSTANLEGVVKTEEFKGLIASGFDKSLRLAISMNWLKVTRNDIPISVLSDLFYNQLLKECGLDAQPDSIKADEKKAL